MRVRPAAGERETGMVSEEFEREVARLARPEMGTERMGPLLHALVRSTRARAVLEVGMGYTTPFLAHALESNRLDFERARKMLVNKTRKMARLGDRWLVEAPALADPGYFVAGYQPSLTVIDNESANGSSARRVGGVLRRLGLDRHLTIARGDFRDLQGALAAAERRFDFVWFDCGGYQEYRDFLDLYWDLIDENGGILVLHYTLTNLSMGAVLQALKLRQATDRFNDYELLSLLEPDKMEQNSCTILRKTRGYRDRIYDTVDAKALGDAAQLLIDEA